MSEDNTAIPSSCGSAGESRSAPALTTQQAHRLRQERRRQHNILRQSGGTSQEPENKRRFQKRYKAATGPAKQRQARRFFRGFKQPRAVLRRRQPRNEARQQQYPYMRPQSMSEETFNRQLAQLTSLQTLRHELDDRMAAVLQELAAARENPMNAMPRIAAAADAQVKVMKQLIQVLQSME
ncbi:hypothetical protein ABMA27_014257 [Loxostege sticticalis]|uniref:Uncharacterized protein n=1 Tax=Loxostege sticticalis TaxID=481309 RepID=A0ABR3IDC3_LOXSC